MEGGSNSTDTSLENDRGGHAIPPRKDTYLQISPSPCREGFWHTLPELSHRYAAHLTPALCPTVLRALASPSPGPTGAAGAQ